MGFVNDPMHIAPSPAPGAEKHASGASAVPPHATFAGQAAHAEPDGDCAAWFDRRRGG